MLVVKPWYRDVWVLPGGATEAGESPRQCAEREAAEETGLTVTAGALLAVHWMPPTSVRRAALHFVFDCGDTAEPGSVLLQASELDDFAFLSLDRAMALMAPWTARRVAAAWRARAEGRPAYLEGPG